MNRILSILLLSMIAVTAVAQTFRYTYEGSTITYRVIDEENKTCEVPGNKGTSNLNDYLVLPQNPIYNNDTYELISIGDKAFFDEMVKTVTIPPSVVSIGELAFGACDKLYSINIPSSVTSIGKYAFSSCTGLTTIDIPSSVTSIGRSAFSGCSGLTNINLNASLTEIESSVFNGCVCLESINIPSSVTSIGDYAFSGCGNLIDIGIPLKVTTIGNSAFKACSRLKSIKIPSSVTTIGSDAFKDCSGLEKAEFETIESLCNIKFGGKESNPIYYSRNLYIGGEEIKDLVIPSTVSIIREYAFVKCNSLMSVSIPSTVVEIGNYAFAECENLRNVISYSKNPCVGENNIFDRCQNLMLNIPASSYNNYSRKSPWSQLECKLMIESIDLNYDTVKVPIGTKYDLSATAQPESASDRSLKWSSSDESVATVDEYGNVLAKAIGGCVITVSANDLSGISESCKVTVVPAAVERIELSHTEWSGFVNEHLTITAAVVPENAADKTLLWTSSDPSVATVDANGQVTAVGVGEAVITVTCGGVSAECKVVVNAKIISVESVTLDRTSVECNPGAVVQLTATVNPDDATDKSLSWSSSNEAVSTVDANGQITAVGVGEAVITVTCGGVSAECKVVVNAKIITVVSVALDRSNVECNPGAVVQLTATVNPDDATDKSLTWNSSNEAVATVDANGQVTAIGVGEVTITATCGGVSAACVVSVKAVDVPVESDIFQYTYEGGTFTYRIKDKENKTCIFEGSYSADDIELVIMPEVAIDDFGNRYTVVDFTGLKERENLKTVKLPSSITSVPDYAFYGCSGLASIQLPSSIIEIGMYAFYGCTSLVSIDLPSSITSIKRDAFNGCSSLMSVELPLAITIININTFAECHSLISIKLPLTITSILVGAFRNCRSLKSVEFPSSITSILGQAFQGCAGLTLIELPSALTKIEYDAFASCLGLKTVVIPQSVTSISDFAFNDCRNITSIVVQSETPPAATDKVFNGSYHNSLDYNKCILYVPAGSENAYRQAELWKNFTQIEPYWVSIDHNTVELHRGEEATLNANVELDLMINKTLTWSSSDESVATVDADGHVTAVGVGEASVMASWGGVSAACVVSVKAVDVPVPDIFQYTYEGGTFTYKVNDKENKTCIFDGSYSADDIESVIMPEVAIDDFGNRYTVVDFTGLKERENLKTVKLPSSIITVPAYAFYGCSSLISVDLPNTITTIEERAFHSCTSLSIIDLPSSLTAIEKYAFYGCKSLESIVLPPNVESIGTAAFEGCSGLISIELPSSITSIGVNAFIFCSNLISINLPESINSVESGVFMDCSSLTSVVIPQSVTSISDLAFNGCNKITSIVVKAVTPPVATDKVFYNKFNYNKCILYVPDGSENAYRQAELWKNFTHIEPYSAQSGITSVGAGNVNVCSEMSKIIIDGAAAGEYVRIFNLSGKEVFHAASTGDCLTYDHAVSGVYIVYVGSEAFKIVVR